jgi:hypothetical protein
MCYATFGSADAAYLRLPENLDHSQTTHALVMKRTENTPEETQNKFQHGDLFFP